MTNEFSDADKRIELIKNNPKDAILKLSWPMMLVMLLMVGYNIVDTIWVAGLGVNALAALGFITPLYMVIVGLGQGMGAGTTSFIARCIGEEDRNKASNGGIHGILIIVFTSIILPIFLIFFLKDILILMGASEVLNISMQYGIIVFLGSFAILFSLLGSSILRAEGDMKRVTYAMILTSILNIILDPIFIYVLNMGISGAAIATIISSFVSAIIIFYWILKKQDTYLKLNFKDFKFNSDIIKDILNVSLPASLEEFTLALSAIGTNTILSFVAGASAVAVYTVGWKIVTLGIIPAIGLEMATLTVAGMAYGARNWKNLEIIFNYATQIGVFLGVILAIITFIFAPQIAAMFTYSTGAEEIITNLISFIRIMSLFFIAIPLGLVSTAIFQAAGKGITSLILNFIRDIGLTLFTSFILAIVFNFGEFGVYWGIVLGVIFGSIINYLYFKFFLGKLKNRNNIFNNKNSKEDILPK
ncbi:MATE family efflux transporter [Methanobrevibacter sp.]|uniref:MATE family efflux transporter n=1 Tax=Methanobrevibacter sp. TaxID=66852 RepID=UPI0026027499|nr:MATE family efflux transporter [uncultured Methanobrevibacter sp.]